MKITNIVPYETGGFYIEIDSAFTLSILDATGLAIGDEVELAIRKPPGSGSVECQAGSGPVDSATSEQEGGFVRTPNGKSDWHI